jgi:hypothetical protein
MGEIEPTSSLDIFRKPARVLCGGRLADKLTQYIEERTLSNMVPGILLALVEAAERQANQRD